MRKMRLFLAAATFCSAIAVGYNQCPSISVINEITYSNIESLTGCEASALCPGSNSTIKCNTSTGNCTSGENSSGQLYVQCGSQISKCS